MKKLGFLVLSLMLIGAISYGADSFKVWRSSYTDQTVTTSNLCVNQRGFLHGVIIGSGTVTNGGSFIMYASSGTVNSTMTYISGSTVYPTNGMYIFDTVAQSTQTNKSGMSYSNTSGMTVTILYDCFPINL